jgi:prepilin-type N-terminal cleavage/methylation domain-containing protein
MRAMLRDESGFTLPELLVSMILMTIILSATLGALDVFGNTTTRDQKLIEAQDKARLSLDQMSREMRNASAYSTDASAPSAIVRAGAWDIVMQTVNPRPPSGANSNTLNLMRVRYCLYTPTNTLWRQEQTWTSATAPAVIADSTCPSSSWTKQTPVATDVVNGGARRVFTYNNGSPTDTTSTPPLLPDIASVRMALWIDVNPGKAPAESQLYTGVFLRNKNRRPVADCTAAPTGNSYVALNGSRSIDPEGGLLTFAWADGATSLGSAGSLVNYQAPTTGSHTFTVTVTDPGGLTSSATCQANVL